MVTSFQMSGKSVKRPVCSDDCLHGSLATIGNSLFSAVVDGCPVYLTAGSEESAVGALISRGAVGVRQYLNSHCIEPIQETYPAFDGARWGVPGGDDETDTGGYPAGESDSIASRQLRSGRPDVDDFLSREFITLKFSEVEFAKRCQLWLTKSHGFPAGVVVAGESESWLLYRLQFDQSADERILENGRQRLATMTADIRKRLQESLHDASGGDTSELFAKLEAVRAECEILTDADFESLWASNEPLSDEQEFREETGDSLHYRPWVEAISKRFGIDVVGSCGLDASIPVLVIGEAVEILASSNSKEWALTVTESTLAKMVDELTEENSMFNPGGTIGEIMSHTLVSGYKPQPELAMFGALCLFAAIIGRKVQDERGVRPNIMVAGLAPSGAGKEHARQVNKLILAMAGGERMLSDALASDSGLLKQMSKSPSSLIQLDELGRMLATLDSASKNPHLYKIKTMLMQLFSSSSTILLGANHSDEKHDVSVRNPNCVVYGTTVPGSFFSSLSKESLSDGFLNRWLVFEITNDDPDPLDDPANIEDVPASLLDTVRWWLNVDAGQDGNLPKLTAERLTASDAAKVEYKALEKIARAKSRAEQDAGTQIWARAYEYGRKLGLIHALSLDKEAREIGVESARWGCRMVLRLTQRMQELCENHITDGAFDQTGRKLLNFIKAAGAAGRTRSELSQFARNLNNRDLREACDKLVEMGDIVGGLRKGASGPAATVYTAL